MRKIEINQDYPKEIVWFKNHSSILKVKEVEKQSGIGEKLLWYFCAGLKGLNPAYWDKLTKWVRNHVEGALSAPVDPQKLFIDGASKAFLNIQKEIAKLPPPKKPLKDVKMGKDGKIKIVPASGKPVTITVKKPEKGATGMKIHGKDVTSIKKDGKGGVKITVPASKVENTYLLNRRKGKQGLK